MNTTLLASKLERLHHDREAHRYSLRRETDYIWEIPESLYLLNTEYFKEGQVVIDMGCGPSVSLKNILGYEKLKEIKYIGVDISREMLKLAKKIIPMGQFRQGNIETVKFPNNYSNVIISLGALHHSINKEKALANWTRTLKRRGYLLLREPTFEALKRGQGESPMEEGIKFSELTSFLKVNNYRMVNVTFFSSQGFHFFNRVMIKLGLGGWQKIKLAWYPIVVLDVLLVKLLSRFLPLFRGQAFTLIAQKV